MEMFCFSSIITISNIECFFMDLFFILFTNGEQHYIIRNRINNTEEKVKVEICMCHKRSEKYEKEKTMMNDTIILHHIYFHRFVPPLADYGLGMRYIGQ